MLIAFHNLFCHVLDHICGPPSHHTALHIAPSPSVRMSVLYVTVTKEPKIDGGPVLTSKAKMTKPHYSDLSERLYEFKSWWTALEFGVINILMQKVKNLSVSVSVCRQRL